MCWVYYRALFFITSSLLNYAHERRYFLRYAFEVNVTEQIHLEKQSEPLHPKKRQIKLEGLIMCS